MGSDWGLGRRATWAVHRSVNGLVHVFAGGDVEMMWWGVGKCMFVLPGLVRLDLGIEGGVDDDDEEVVDLVGRGGTLREGKRGEKEQWPLGEKWTRRSLSIYKQTNKWCCGYRAVNALFWGFFGT